jgi:hypothetical protein
MKGAMYHPDRLLSLIHGAARFWPPYASVLARNNNHAQHSEPLLESDAI